MREPPTAEPRIRLKLTKRVVDGLAPRSGPSARDYFVWDAELPGFGVRVWPSGRRVFTLQYRDAGGRTRRVIVGEHGPLTPEQARAEALALRGTVVTARRDPAVADPAQARQRARAARRAAHDAPTVAELADAFLAECAAKRKASTARGYQYLLAEAPGPRAKCGVIRRALGPRKVGEVTRADVAAFHLSLQRTPYQANRALAVLSALFAYAEQHGHRAEGTNPCRAVAAYREHKRERYLSEAEFAALGAALTQAEHTGLPIPEKRARRRANVATAKHRPKDAGADGARPPKPFSPVAVGVLRFLLLTGWREGEALTLAWRDVDLEHRRATLPDTKTGRSVRQLGEPALAVLEAMRPYRRAGNPYVFPGAKPGAPFTDTARVWDAVRHAAGLADVRLHDLRHAFASVAASDGLTLPVIGALLGHRDSASTARYAHLVDAARARAAEQTSGAVAKALAGTPVPLKDGSGRSRDATLLPFARRA